MHSTWKVFVLAEGSGKIHRASRHNVRVSGDTRCFARDSVFCKRNDCGQGNGPGKIIRQEGELVLVENGSNYIRVHLCRLALEYRS